jgi:hypothetical protein
MAKKSFASALRKNLKQHAPGTAMRKTWKAVKAGRVARPPHRRRRRRSR